MPKQYCQFNHPNTIIVISSYPDIHNGIKNLNAVAWHSQKTLRSLASSQQQIIVFAENTGSTQKIYTDGPNILVIRSWIKGNFTSLFKTLFQTLSFSQAKTILFQFEFNIFGGIAPVLLIPLMLLFYRLINKKIIFELHQVITDITKLSQHLNLKNQLTSKIYNLGLLGFYKSLGILANQIIVLEEELTFRLKSLIPLSKIDFIPISITKDKLIKQSTAKKTLGYKVTDFIVLSFGYVNWYKGSDWIVNTFNSITDINTKLILAGGPSPTLKDKPYYQNYYQKIETQVQKNKNITLTGFIPDNQVGLYFSACDIVVLPYRVFMSSSGPLSWAFSYCKPVIMANTLKKYITSTDFKFAMDSNQLTPSSIFFSLNQKQFALKISQLKNSDYLNKITGFSKSMFQLRSAENVKTKYIQLISKYETSKVDIAIST